MIRAALLLIVALASASVFAESDPLPTIGSLAHPPYPDRPPQILVVRDGQLARSNGDTMIESSLAELSLRFHVRISQKVLAGYVLDLDQSDPDRQYAGFDLDAQANHPWLAPWFHDPFPSVPGSSQYTAEIWTYATGGARAEGLDLLRAATAYTHLDHAFFPAAKFGRGFYWDPSRRQVTDQGLESVLHEALHIWHARHFAEVTALLHTRGSYFDRAAAATRICSRYASIMSIPDDKPTCGFASEFAAVLKILTHSKWPQRYGALTRRQPALVKDRYGCSSSSREMTLAGRVVCVGKDLGNRMGDLHAFDNELEYFAILMQLYAFSPRDFQRSATPQEAAFARRLFSTDFN